MELVSGGRGEFTVRVAGEIVAQKTWDGFPTPDHCVDAVVAALA